MTIRVQIEGTNGILAIITKSEVETAEAFNKRYCASVNKHPDAVRAKLMCVSVMGEVLHETINF